MPDQVKADLSPQPGLRHPQPARLWFRWPPESAFGQKKPPLSVENRGAAAEDAVSEALVAALRTWPERGVPNNPDARLITAARNRQKNRLRASLAHQEAEPELILRSELPGAQDAIGDSRLTLMFV